ncbi:MAG: hypothetical protein V1921_08720 [Candidatus Altiarchaeota archaeon]
MESKAYLTLAIMIIALTSTAAAEKMAVFSAKGIAFLDAVSLLLELFAFILLVKLWSFLGETGLGPSLKIVAIAMSFYVLANFLYVSSTYSFMNVADMYHLISTIGDVFLVVGLYNMLSLKSKPHVEFFSRLQDLFR